MSEQDATETVAVGDRKLSIPNGVVRRLHQSRMATPGAEDDPALLDSLADEMYAAEASAAEAPAGWAHVREMISGLALVSRDVYRDRLATCAGCEHVRKTPVNPLALESKTLILQCKKCGCIMNAKARMSLGACPLGKFT